MTTTNLLRISPSARRARDHPRDDPAAATRTRTFAGITSPRDPGGLRCAVLRVSVGGPGEQQRADRAYAGSYDRIGVIFTGGARILGTGDFETRVIAIAGSAASLGLFFRGRCDAALIGEQQHAFPEARPRPSAQNGRIMAPA